jgi:hypothetical protein
MDPRIRIRIRIRAKFYGSATPVLIQLNCVHVACLAAQEDLPHDPVDAGAHVVPLDHLKKKNMKTFKKKPRKRITGSAGN